MANIIVIFAVFFTTGVWCAGFYSWSLPLLYVLAFILFCVAGWRMQRDHPQLVQVLAILFFITGMIRFIHTDALSPFDISHYAGQVVTVQGTIADVPQVTPLDDEKVKVKYIVSVAQQKSGQQHFLPATGKLIVTTRQSKQEHTAKYGDRLLFTGQVMLLHGYNNPGMFDNVMAQKRQGITARMSVESGKIDNKSVADASAQSWQTVLATWRATITQNMQKVMPASEAGILTGMLFGGYSGIKKEVITDFASTGIVHILSVSGTHIVLVAGVVLWFGTRLKLKYGIVAWIAALSIIFYSVFSGLTPPVIRSAIMGLVTLAAVGLGRDKDAPAALSLATLGMVVYQPALIYDISFQLSFCSTAGLVFLYPKTLKALATLPSWIAGGVAVTLAAQLGVLPFVAWYFNSFSLSSFVANMIIVPLVEAVVVLGLLGALAGTVFALLGQIIFVLCSLLIGLVVQLTAGLAAIPGGTVYMPPLGIIGGIVYYFLLAWVYGYRPSWMLSPTEMYRRWPRYAAMLLVVATLMGTVYIWYPRPVYVHFIDVGQGDAVLITTPHGRAILVDTGGTAGEATSFDVGERVVIPYLKHYGVLAVDYLFLTHGHQDHAGGAAAIAATFPVKNILLAREGQLTPAIAALLHNKNSKNFIPTFEGQKILLDGVTISVEHAVGDVPTQQGNEVSSVIRVSFGQHSFLITGDLEAKGEAMMLASGHSLRSTVLKVGHHGAKTSSTSEFLRAVMPHYAVISVGYGNRFGHPSPDVLQRLAEIHSKVYRTDQQGAVVFTTDGNKLGVETFRF